MKRILTLFLVFLICLSLVIGGCSTSKKPAPKPAPQTRITPKSPGTPAKKPSNPAHALATKLADNVKKVNGVKNATVVVSGSTAFVGLEIEPVIEDKKTNEIKSKAAKSVKNTDSSIKTVHVTTDPNLITRIKKIASGIMSGKPISSFSNEIAEITRRITPKTKTK